MNDIRQLTNYDIDSAAEQNMSIKIGGPTGQSLSYPYKIITSAMLGSEHVIKFGYCTNDNQGMNYPIFLTLDGVEREFQLGKTGMFEFQPEEWKDVNSSNPDEQQMQTARVELSQALVPKDIPFCLDYIFSV